MYILGLETLFSRAISLNLVKNEIGSSATSVAPLWFSSATDVDDVSLPSITEMHHIRQISHGILYHSLMMTPPIHPRIALYCESSSG